MKNLKETEKEYDDRLNRRKTTEQRTGELPFGNKTVQQTSFLRPVYLDLWHFAFCILCIRVCLFLSTYLISSSVIM